MFARPRRLDGGIQGQQVGLAGDVLDDADLGGDGPHRLHRLGYRLTAQLRVERRLAGDPFGLVGIARGLLDIGGHLFDRRRRLLGRRGLFGGALTHRLGRRRQLLAARSDVAGGAGRLDHHLAQPRHHGLERDAEAVLFRQPPRHHRQIAPGDVVGHPGGAPQVDGHAVEGVDQVLDLVVAGDANGLIEVADRHRVGQRHRVAQAPADRAGDPDRGAQGDRQRDQDDGDRAVAQGDELGLDVVHVDAGAHHPAPGFIGQGRRDLADGPCGARLGEEIVQVAAAGPSLGDQVAEIGVAVVILGGEEVFALALGVKAMGDAVAGIVVDEEIAVAAVPHAANGRLRRRLRRRPVHLAGLGHVVERPGHVPCRLDHVAGEVDAVVHHALLERAGGEGRHHDQTDRAEDGQAVKLGGDGEPHRPDLFLR